MQQHSMQPTPHSVTHCVSRLQLQQYSLGAAAMLNAVQAGSPGVTRWVATHLQLLQCPACPAAYMRLVRRCAPIHTR